MQKTSRFTNRYIRCTLIYGVYLFYYFFSYFVLSFLLWIDTLETVLKWTFIVIFAKKYLPNTLSFGIEYTLVKKSIMDLQLCGILYHLYIEVLS